MKPVQVTGVIVIIFLLTVFSKSVALAQSCPICPKNPLPKTGALECLSDNNGANNCVYTIPYPYKSSIPARLDANGAYGHKIDVVLNDKYSSPVKSIEGRGNEKLSATFTEDDFNDACVGKEGENIKVTFTYILKYDAVCNVEVKYANSGSSFCPSFSCDPNDQTCKETCCEFPNSSVNYLKNISLPAGISATRTCPVETPPPPTPPPPSSVSITKKIAKGLVSPNYCIDNWDNPAKVMDTLTINEGELEQVSFCYRVKNTGSATISSFVSAYDTFATSDSFSNMPFNCPNGQTLIPNGETICRSNINIYIDSLTGGQDIDTKVRLNTISNEGVNAQAQDSARIIVNGPQQPNSAPTCATISPSSPSIPVNTSQTFSSTVSDADGDTIKYYWKTTGGNPSRVPADINATQTSSSGSEVKIDWTSPSVSSVIEFRLYIGDETHPVILCDPATATITETPPLPPQYNVEVEKKIALGTRSPQYCEAHWDNLDPLVSNNLEVFYNQLSQGLTFCYKITNLGNLPITNFTAQDTYFENNYRNMNLNCPQGTALDRQKSTICRSNNNINTSTLLANQSASTLVKILATYTDLGNASGSNSATLIVKEFIESPEIIKCQIDPVDFTLQESQKQNLLGIVSLDKGSISQISYSWRPADSGGDSVGIFSALEENRTTWTAPKTTGNFVLGLKVYETENPNNFATCYSKANVIKANLECNSIKGIGPTVHANTNYKITAETKGASRTTTYKWESSFGIPKNSSDINYLWTAPNEEKIITISLILDNKISCPNVTTKVEKEDGWPDFGLRLEPLTKSVNKGDIAEYSVIYNSYNGWVNELSQTNVYRCPQGSVCALNPTAISPTPQGTIQTLTVQTNNADLGDHAIAVSATGIQGTIQTTKTAQARLVINQNISCQIAPLDISLPVGSSIELVSQTFGQITGSLRYAWTAPLGSFSNPQGIKTTYNATTAGNFDINLTVTDTQNPQNNALCASKAVITETANNKITGNVYIRTDASCDASTNYAKGVSIKLTGELGETVKEAATDNQGSFTLNNLTNGRYVLSILSPPGYTASDCGVEKSINLQSVCGGTAGQCQGQEAQENFVIKPEFSPVWFQAFSGNIHSNSKVELEDIPVNRLVYRSNKEEGTKNEQFGKTLDESNYLVLETWLDEGLLNLDKLLETYMYPGLTTSFIGPDYSINNSSITKVYVQDYGRLINPYPININRIERAFDSIISNISVLEAGQIYKNNIPRWIISQNIEYKIANLGVSVVVVNKDLEFINDIEFKSENPYEQTIIFLVPGKVTIGPNVKRIDAIIYSEGPIIIKSDGGENDERLIMYGGLYSKDEIKQQRSRKNIDLNVSPSAIFYYNPLVLKGNINKEMLIIRTGWKIN